MRRDEHQLQHRQEILVPADRDAVFGNAAEARENALVELVRDLGDVLDRSRAGLAVISGPFVGQRLDLQTVHPDHAKTLVQKIMRQRVPGRPEADDEHIFAVVGQRVRALCVQRVPARQQAVDLKTVGQVEHIGQRSGFGERDVDRLLLLENAALHAVVADAVAGAGAHRVVDRDQRERPDRIALLFEQVHLRDLFVERAALGLDAERVALRRAVRLAKAGRARILLALVADQAVVDLGQRIAHRAAVVGQLKTVAPAHLSSAPRMMLCSSGSGWIR